MKKNLFPSEKIWQFACSYLSLAGRKEHLAFEKQVAGMVSRASSLPFTLDICRLNIVFSREKSRGKGKSETFLKNDWKAPYIYYYLFVLICNFFTMKQLCFIHWGTLSKDNDELFETMQNRVANPFEEKKRWKNTLWTHLPEFQIIKPEMPNKELACYKIRRLWFEKHLPYFDDENFILIGHSLGAMFLIKYLWENGFPFKISQLHLVAPVLNDEGLTPGDNHLGDFAYEPSIIKNLEKVADQIFIWHSKDDPCVPFHQAEKIKAELNHASFTVFEERQHINQAEFPELIKIIKNSF